jgi:hypothetical protein
MENLGIIINHDNPSLITIIINHPRIIINHISTISITIPVWYHVDLKEKNVSCREKHLLDCWRRTTYRRGKK